MVIRLRNNMLVKLKDGSVGLVTCNKILGQFWNIGLEVYESNLKHNTHSAYDIIEIRDGEKITSLNDIKKSFSKFPLLWKRNLKLEDELAEARKLKEKQPVLVWDEVDDSHNKSIRLFAKYDILVNPTTGEEESIEYFTYETNYRGFVGCSSWKHCEKYE